MIIDLILDRQDGAIFRAWEFGNEIADYAEVFDCAKPILEAIEKEDEEATKAALCQYVIKQGYNPQICDYINSENWVGTPSHKKATKTHKAEVEITEDGRIFISIESDNLTAEEENALYACGLELMNNGVTLDNEDINANYYFLKKNLHN